MQLATQVIEREGRIPEAEVEVSSAPDTLDFAAT